MRFAMAGLSFAWRTQANFRIETACAALALGLAVWARAPLAPILLTCALVLSLELVNTAIEALVDLASPELHPLAKVAKDVAAAAVLIASIFAVIVALAELMPKILLRL
ncbi:diacylglycerol kinase [Deinococcus yavapaiensis]|nr:diacylglycerol kinase [Deinococcus yavapaiensis]